MHIQGAHAIVIQVLEPHVVDGYLAGTFLWRTWTSDPSAELVIRNWSSIPVVIDDVIITRFGAKPAATYANYLAQLEEDAAAGLEEAQATLTSGIIRSDGRNDLYLGGAAYTAANPFGVNTAPSAATSAYPGWQGKADFEFDALGSLLGWDGSPSTMKGIMFDSMQGWGQLLNYQTDHWRNTAFPLGFDRTNGNAVALMNIWGTYDYARALAGELHRHDQWLMGNDAYFQAWYFMGVVDLPGREVFDHVDDQWVPPSHETYRLFRSMAARRPFWTLMNANYEDGSPMEDYFQRSLFYGIFPSFYNAHDGSSFWYWWDSRYYNRDRHLFIKYVPLIQQIDNARWEPVAHATASPAGTLVERYGKVDSEDLVYTLHNPTDAAQIVALTLDLEALGASAVTDATEWIHGAAVTITEAKSASADLSLSVPAQGFAAVGVTASPLETEGCGGDVHFADTDADNLIVLSELLRVIQFYNLGGHHCAAPPEATEDGYVPGAGADTTCCPHDSDYAGGADWAVDLGELLRLIQFFNGAGYHACPGEGTEDGFCVGAEEGVR